MSTDVALFLQFQIGPDRYALDVVQVALVLPLVAIKQIPHAPRGIAGAFDFHGQPVPVIDLSELALGTAASRQLSTRLILVHYRDRSGTAQLLGLLAEKATQTVRCALEDFVPSGVTSQAARYLGPVAAKAGGLLQQIDVQKILPESVSEALFRAVEEDRACTAESQPC
jgi:chemotaxis-related protein WspB